jgi:hypothetical protein
MAFTHFTAFIGRAVQGFRALKMYPPNNNQVMVFAKFRDHDAALRACDQVRVSVPPLLSPLSLSLWFPGANAHVLRLSAGQGVLPGRSH